MRSADRNPHEPNTNAHMMTSGLSAGQASNLTDTTFQNWVPQSEMARTHRDTHDEDQINDRVKNLLRV